MGETHKHTQKLKKNHGFTIIELLIVIIVIGILATLILIGYNNISKQAAVTRIKHDAEQTYKQLDLYNARTNTLPIDQAAARSIIALSDGTTLEYTLTSATSYCITTSSQTAQTNYYFDSTARSVLQGKCSGHTGYVNTSGQPVATTLTGAGTSGYVDGAPSVAKFNADFGGLSVTSDGTTYLADRYNKRIRKILPDGTVSTFAGSGANTLTDGTGTAAAFTDPIDIIFDSTGNMIVADNTAFRKITPAGVVTTIGYAGTLGTMAIDPSDTIYYSSNCEIWKMNASYTQTKIAGASGSCSEVDGTGAAARFVNPYCITWNPDNNLYVVQLSSKTDIRKVTQAGVVTTFAGTSDNMYARDFIDGTGTNASFPGPRGIVSDTNGDMYLMDAAVGYRHGIRKITTAGVVTTLMGSTTGFADGTGNAAKFANPSAVRMGPNRTMYIYDSGNYKVRKVTLP